MNTIAPIEYPWWIYAGIGLLIIVGLFWARVLYEEMTGGIRSYGFVEFVFGSILMLTNLAVGEAARTPFLIGLVLVFLSFFAGVVLF